MKLLGYIEKNKWAAGTLSTLLLAEEIKDINIRTDHFALNSPLKFEGFKLSAEREILYPNGNVEIHVNFWKGNKDLRMQKLPLSIWYTCDSTYRQSCNCLRIFLLNAFVGRIWFWETQVFYKRSLFHLRWDKREMCWNANDVFWLKTINFFSVTGMWKLILGWIRSGNQILKLPQKMMSWEL